MPGRVGNWMRGQVKDTEKVEWLSGDGKQYRSWPSRRVQGRRDRRDASERCQGFFQSFPFRTYTAVTI